MFRNLSKASYYSVRRNHLSANRRCKRHKSSLTEVVFSKLCTVTNVGPALRSVRYSLASLSDEAGNRCDLSNQFGISTIGEPDWSNFAVWMGDNRDVILREGAESTQVSSVAEKQEIERTLPKFC